VPYGPRATASTTTGRSRRIASYGLAAKTSGIGARSCRIARIHIGGGRGPVVTVVTVIPVAIAVDIPVACTAGLQFTGICRGSRTVGAVVAIADPCHEAVAIARAIEGAQVSINVVVIRRSLHYDDATAIVRIVEIRIVPAVPHKVAVPAEIRISESKPQTIVGTIERIAITISISHGIVWAYSSGSIVGIVSVIIVEIGPAGFVLGFHPDVIVAWRCAVVFSIRPCAGAAGAVVACILIR